MYHLEDFLENISPFLEGESLSKFKAELEKVPNYEEAFDKLLEENPNWLKSALATRKKDGFHVYFFLDTINWNPAGRKFPNKLCLRNFICGTQPTIKVEVYR